MSGRGAQSTQGSQPSSGWIEEAGQKGGDQVGGGPGLQLLALRAQPLFEQDLQHRPALHLLRLRARLGDDRDTGAPPLSTLARPRATPPPSEPLRDFHGGGAVAPERCEFIDEAEGVIGPGLKGAYKMMT